MKDMQITLCPARRDNFREAGFLVRRSALADNEKSSCCYCNYRMGHDYLVKKRPETVNKLRARRCHSHA